MEPPSCCLAVGGDSVVALVEALDVEIKCSQVGGGRLAGVADGEREAMDRQRVRAHRRLEIDVDAPIEVFRGGTVDQPPSRSVGLDTYFVLA